MRHAGDVTDAEWGAIGQWTTEIVKRSYDVTGSKVLPRRRAVERALA